MWHVGVMNCFHIRQWVAKDYVKIYLRFTFSLFHSVGRSLARAYTHQHTQCRQFVCLVAVYAVRCALQLTYCCNVRCIKLTPSWHTLIMCVVTYLLLSLIVLIIKIQRPLLELNGKLLNHWISSVHIIDYLFDWKFTRCKSSDSFKVRKHEVSTAKWIKIC